MDKPNTRNDKSKKSPNSFDENYFSTGPYAHVSFKRFSQYWWSNRFYALLIRQYGPTRGRLLEIGCGLGHLLGWLSKYYQVYGSDINLWALIQARHNVPNGNFIHLSAENLHAFPHAVFDIVIAKHVVEHLEHPVKAIAEISRVLNSGGLFVLSTPNLSSPMRNLKKSNWVGYKDPTHISLKPPEEWLIALRHNGFIPRRVFSDGFWDSPYLPFIPAFIQKLTFGAPGGLQAIFGLSAIPLCMGESLIVIANKK